jgi:hypothetical protein
MDSRAFSRRAFEPAMMKASVAAASWHTLGYAAASRRVMAELFDLCERIVAVYAIGNVARAIPVGTILKTLPSSSHFGGFALIVIVEVDVRVFDGSRTCA